MLAKAHLTLQSLVSNGQLDERIGLTAALLCRLSDNKKEADQVIQPSLGQKKRITPGLKCLERQAHGDVECLEGRLSGAIDLTSRAAGGEATKETAI